MTNPRHPTLMEIADDIRTWAVVVGQCAVDSTDPFEAEKERRIADAMNRWVEQVTYQARVLTAPKE